MRITRLFWASVDMNGNYTALFDTDEGPRYGLHLVGPHLRWLFEFRGDEPPIEGPVVLSGSPQEVALLRRLDELLLNPVVATPRSGDLALTQIRESPVSFQAVGCDLERR